jgi:phenylpyruvate tautomerase PptA (4-oxalocrotonate tautomerase family)
VAQIKIYGLRSVLGPRIQALSDAIHASVVETLQFPPDKRFHRFISLDREEFIHPPDRSDEYTIIEIAMFEGRSSHAKKELIRLLFSNISARTGILPNDIEITIFETPKGNWGIRGLPADELTLGYKIAV